MQIEAKAGQRGRCVMWQGGTSVTSSTQNQNCRQPRLGAGRARGSHPLQLCTGGTRSTPNARQMRSKGQEGLLKCLFC